MAHLAHDPDARPDGLSFSDLVAVAPCTARLNDGDLEIGGVSMAKLAQTHGTALYVYDELHIRKQLSTYLSELRARLPQADVAYAGKAFICKAMARLVHEEDGHLDVSSGGELALALAAEFPAEKIVVHGNNKTRRELHEAIAAGVGLIVVDSFEELLLISELAAMIGVVQDILLRFKPGIVADTHEFIRTGAEDSKFGFGSSDGTMTKAIQLAKQTSQVNLLGVHVHIGSQIFYLESFEATINKLCSHVDQWQRELNFIPKILDFGGGLGIAYLADDKPATISDYASVIASALEKNCAKYGLEVPRVIVEPGRSIVANAGVTLYTVGSIKDLGSVRTYLAVDGGMSDNLRVALYGARYESLIVDRAGAARDSVVTIAGKHCESGDVVGVDVSLQKAEPGDILCMFCTGAYGHSMSNNYNRQVRPGVVFVRDGKVREVIRRETYEDLLITDLG
jgi:diaminopimelate decarboxylase